MMQPVLYKTSPHYIHFFSSQPLTSQWTACSLS